MIQTEIGKLITDHAERDAIHIAVAPVEAGGIIYPGASIGFSGDGHTVIMVPPENKSAIGISDPFYKQRIMPGERFYMFLLPNTITSLKHNWTHPAFENQKPQEPVVEGKAASEKWMLQFCDKIGEDYGDVMEAAETSITQGYAVLGRSGQELPDEFWDHYERITGKKVPQEDRSESFSCSC